MNDPHTSKRVTNAKLLRDLETADQMFFEEMLRTTLQESTLGYAEAEITLVAEQEFYRLPHGFRQFLYFTKLDSERNTLGSMSTKHVYEPTQGMQILDGKAGFRLYPAPDSDDADTWTLGYIRGPGKLHYAQASHVGEKSLRSSSLGIDAGEIILVPDYYNGQHVRIYAADVGAPQYNVVTKSTVDGDQVILHMRHDLFPTSGDVWYEIRPTMPEPYDSIYAVEVAIMNLDRRIQGDHVAALEKHRKRLLSMCRDYFASNTADRAPSRVKPVRRIDRTGLSQAGVYS